MIEMIPREYWLQLHRELTSLVPELLEAERVVKAERKKQEAERIARIRNRYDQVLVAKRKDKEKTTRRRAQLKAAQDRYKERHGKTPNKPI